MFSSVSLQVFSILYKYFGIFVSHISDWAISLYYYIFLPIFAYIFCSFTVDWANAVRSCIFRPFLPFSTHFIAYFGCFHLIIINFTHSRQNYISTCIFIVNQFTPLHYPPIRTIALCSVISETCSKQCSAGFSKIAFFITSCNVCFSPDPGERLLNQRLFHNRGIVLNILPK